jgi:hypothetical protein
MKHLCIMAIACCVFTACNNTATHNTNTTDSVQMTDTISGNMHTDSIPDGNSSSSSDFNKGSSSPAGSTGVDSAVVKSSDSMSLRKVQDKKTAKDSVKR